MSTRSERAARLALALGLLAAAGSGCRGRKSISDYTGHYEGTLGAEVVQGEATRSGPKSISLTLSSSVPVTLALTLDSASTLELQVPAISEAGYSLHRAGAADRDRQENGCFTDAARSALLCLGDREVWVNIVDPANRKELLVAHLARFDHQGAVTLEEPAVYTLAMIDQRAKNLSFESLIESERAVQASHRARSAYGNLLPHATLNSVEAVLSGGAMGIIGASSDLVPFLFPSRHFSARREARLWEAELDAFRILRADLSLQAQAISYLMNRDSRVLEQYALTLSRMETLRQQVAVREELGEFQAGTSDTILTVVNSMKQSKISLENALAESRASLAQLVGLTNPQGILSVTLPEEPGEPAPAPDQATLIQTGLARSFELRQVDSLIQAAKLEKKAKSFSWIDPAGDATATLSFGRKDSIAVSASQVRELARLRAQVQAGVVRKCEAALREHESSLSALKIAEENFALQKRRADRLLVLLDLGSDVSVFELATTFQDQLHAAAEFENAKATFRVSELKLDRLLLDGSFSSDSH